VRPPEQYNPTSLVLRAKSFPSDRSAIVTGLFCVVNKAYWYTGSPDTFNHICIEVLQGAFPGHVRRFLSG